MTEMKGRHTAIFAIIVLVKVSVGHGPDRRAGITYATKQSKNLIGGCAGAKATWSSRENYFEV